MKKIKAITNLISLILTASLLVLVTVAWYATNKTANVNDARGSVAAQPELVNKVDYYNFSAVNGTTYTIEDHAVNTGTCNLQDYEFPSVKPTLYLIRIKLQPNTSIHAIRFISSAKKFAGFSSRTVGNAIRNDANGIFDTDNENISLSSAIKFAYLGYTTDENYYVKSNTTVVIPEQNLVWRSFEYNSNGDITLSTVDILNSDIPSVDGSVYIHLLLDYDVAHLNEIYGNNLSNKDVLLANGGPDFSDRDFIIYLLG